MNVSCKVIEDLLPMYHDGICSKESTALIEEHLKDCPQCSGMLSDLRTDMDIQEKNVDDIKPLKKIQKRFQKTRLRWLASVLAILAMIPIAFLGWNEYSAQGAAYSNQDELYCGNAFMTCLMEGDYAKAYSYLDVDAKKHTWLTNWFEEKDLVNMEADGLKMFCQLGEKVEAAGGIESYEYLGTSVSHSVDHRGNQVHQIIYRIKYAGQEQRFSVDISENGIHSFSGNGSFLTDPLAQLCIWGEYLWQDYQGCYYDPNLREYVYYNQEQ